LHNKSFDISNNEFNNNLVSENVAKHIKGVLR